MATDKGWIKLEKTIDELGIMTDDEPFDKTHAYIDMKIMCNYEDHPFSPCGGQHVVVIHRGQFHTSVEKMAKRWNWSKNKTVGFLKKLSKLGLIRMTSHNYGTTITLVKYDNSTIEAETDGATDGATEGTPKGKTDGKTDGARYKKNKKSKNNKNQRNQEGAQRPDDCFVWGELE